jgi:PAS domain S-box-containing protein
MPDKPREALPARILICEDEIMLAKDMARTLQSLGYEVADTVSTGEEAVQRAEQAQPDLILMDIKLGGILDGIEAAKLIRARRDIPVVYLTGYAESDVLQRAKISEPYGYLAKPMGLLELRSTVETALYKHKADRRVRESELWMRSMFDSLGEAVLLLTPDRIVKDVNPAAEKMFGYRHQDLVGHSTERLHVDRDHYLEFGSRVERHFARGESAEFEFLGRRVNGEVFSTEHTVSLLRDRAGTPIGIVSVVRDITNKKLGQQALLENFSIIENLVEKAADGFAVCHNIDEEPHVRFTHWNPRMQELTGYSIAEINRLGWYQTVYPDPHVRQDALERMNRMRVGDDLRGEEWVITTKQGEAKTLSISTSVVQEEVDRVHVLATMRDISDRKKAEAELVRAKDDWERTFDAVSDFIMILDNQQRIVRLNRAAAQTFGLSTEEAVGSFCFKSVHGTEQPPPLCPFEALSEDQSEHSAEIFVERLGMTFDVTVSPILDAEGNLDGCVHVARDITERKTHDAALREKTRILNSLIEAMPDPVFFKDSQRRYLLLNSATEKFTGRNPSEAIGLTDEDLLPSALAAQSRAGDEETLKFLKPTRLEECAVDIHGAETILDTIKFPIFDDRGTVVGMGGVGRDITALKETENKLRKSEAFLNLLFESIQDGLNITDTNFTILRANSAMEGRWAHSTPLVGKKCYEAFNARTEPCEVCPVRETLETHAPAYREVSWTMPGGQIGGWLESYAFPLAEPTTGELVAVAKYVRDITDRKTAEEQIKASLKEKEVLLREIHHRVKNNLAVIISLLNLQSGYAGDESQRRMLDEATSRIRSMAVAHELLYQSENLAHISAAEYVQRLSNHLVAHFGSIGKDIEVSTDINPVQLPLDVAIPVGFIMTELLSNCFKHAFRDRDTGTVAISLREIDDNGVELVVADNGVGMPEHVDHTNPQSFGFDLVDTFVTQLDGEMRVVKTEGTTICIRFPGVRG